MTQTMQDPDYCQHGINKNTEECPHCLEAYFAKERKKKEREKNE